ncbi:hypothetical protein GOBAR_DD36000 [Gossypium barbadense]|nr:hypothetical protein GOBAR_DD36000 [Gossypium barbadense]
MAPFKCHYLSLIKNVTLARATTHGDGTGSCTKLSPGVSQSPPGCGTLVFVSECTRGRVGHGYRYRSVPECTLEKCGCAARARAQR